jgi:acetolactate synthase-1/2/3 large subunit
MAIERDTMLFAIEQYNTMAQGGNYRDVAQALGGWAERVEKPDDFIPALKRAIEVTKTGQPALLDCITKEGYDFSKYP